MRYTDRTKFVLVGTIELRGLAFSRDTDHYLRSKYCFEVVILARVQESLLSFRK